MINKPGVILLDYRLIFCYFKFWSKKKLNISRMKSFLQIIFLK